MSGKLQFKNRKGFHTNKSHYSILSSVARESNKERFINGLRELAKYWNETKNIIPSVHTKKSQHDLYISLRKPNSLCLHSVHMWVRRTMGRKYR